MKKLYKIFQKTILFIAVFILSDITIMFFLPEKIKEELYIGRAHRIKSYYYHHDFRPMASWYDTWGYKKPKIFTNSEGFKDKSKRKINFKKENILFIGDSFTEGVGLPYEESFVGIIDQKILEKNKQILVLNAGVQSYSPAVYLSKLNHILNIRKLPINKVFVVMANGDINDDLYRYKDVNEKYIVTHEDYKQNQVLINIINFYKSNTLTYQFITRITPIKPIVKSWFKKKEYTFDEAESYLLKNTSNEEILNILNSFYDHQYLLDNNALNDWGLEGLKKSKKYLEKLIYLCKQKKINVTLIVMEEAVVFLNSVNIDFYKNYWRKVAINNNINFIYLEDYHSSYNDKFEAYRNLFFIRDNHWNEKGNQMVAEEIIKKSKYLQKKIND